MIKNHRIKNYKLYLNEINNNIRFDFSEMGKTKLEK